MRDEREEEGAARREEASIVWHAFIVIRTRRDWNGRPERRVGDPTYAYTAERRVGDPTYAYAAARRVDDPTYAYAAERRVDDPTYT